MLPFTEIQKFRQWWIWLILLSVIVISFFSVFKNMSVSTEGDTYHYVQIAVAVIGPLLIALLIFSIKLETRVDGTGIYYRFFPMHLTKQTILWDDVATVVVTPYNPIKDFGGWGWRYSFKKGRALNIKGNMGLQIVYKNGKKLLLGTQKPEELKMVLKDLGKSSEG